jgi:murein DD-endopeptidase MepM/ murein hydrolase activator NlpD
MNNRFFSLIIVPDSGQDMKTGAFTGNFVLSIFGILIAAFLVCLFFIIGYHIKLSQEKDYKTSIATMHHHLDTIDKSQQHLAVLNEKLKEMQWNDWAYRLHALMKVLPDSDMYLAGIGGHAVIDESGLVNFPDDLKIELRDLFTGIRSLENRVSLQEKSLKAIQSNLQENLRIIDNTPTILPTPSSFRVTSRWGYRVHPISGHRHFHGAIDLGGKRGDPVIATCNGTVIFAQYYGALGNCIRITNEYGYEVLYGHLHRTRVKVGDKVKKGDLIGNMGGTGNATSVHLHYGIALHDIKRNPLEFINP